MTSQLRIYAFAALIVASGVTLLAPPAAATTTHTVCPGGSCAFTTIQDALAAADDGDTIQVEPGTYAGPVLISKSVTLCSAPVAAYWCEPQPETTIITGGGLYPVFIDADGVTVQGFTIQNPGETAVDGAFGPVDPSLVAVYGDQVSILDNVLQQPASAPLPGQTRWYTIGINIGTGSDLVTIERNTLRDFVPAIAPGGVCPQAPCQVVGILDWGRGGGLRIVDNEIDLGGTSIPATGIDFDRNGVVHVYDNVIRVPGSPPGSDPVSIGIDGGVSDQAQIFENDIGPATGETPFGIYGVYGIFSRSEINGNTLRDAQHGIMLRSTAVGENEVRGNFFLNGNQGVLNFAYGTFFENNHFSNLARGILLDRVPGDPGASQDVVLFGNTFDQTPNTLAFTDTVGGAFVDATHNDWGVYTRDLVESTITDANGTNTYDISCFIDSDGQTPVCPDAYIAQETLNAVWPREVRFSDVSQEGNREIESREWTLPDATTATTPTVTRAFSPGTYTVGLRVTDSEGFSDEDELTFTLTNAAPSLTAPATLAATEGATLAHQLVAGDADGDTLALGMSGAPEGASLTNAGLFRWRAPYDAAGQTWTVVFSATDGASTTYATTTLTATDTPTAPVLADPGVRSVYEGALVSVPVSASDPDGGLVTLTATGVPPGATFTDHGDNTGLFSWTPGLGTAGTYTIVITATAANAMTDTETLVVNVGQQASLALARVGAFEAMGSPGQTLALQATLSNTGTGTDVFTLSTTSSAGAAWTRVTSAGPTLAAGEATLVTVDVTVPAAGGVTTITLKACSQAQTTVCKSITWRVSTPLVLALDMGSAFTTLGSAPNGTARVTWLDGTPITGASIELREQTSGSVTLSSNTVVTTDATGRAAFTFASPTSRLPGNHVVFGTALYSGVTPGTASRTYTVTAT